MVTPESPMASYTHQGMSRYTTRCKNTMQKLATTGPGCVRMNPAQS